ncbi:heme utilization protein [Bifidobacterium mongoliense]|uniref:heme utilization protein n=1 Tax=Bifidobacterium mongoliense TaxID=518643 RepID=UPI0030EE06D4
MTNDHVGHPLGNADHSPGGTEANRPEHEPGNRTEQHNAPGAPLNGGMPGATVSGSGNEAAQPRQSSPSQPYAPSPQGPQSPPVTQQVPGNTPPPSRNPMLEDLAKPHTWKGIGISTGIGLASAVILALITAGLLLIVQGSMLRDISASLSGLSGSSQSGGMSDSGAETNFLQMLIIALVAGVSGQFSVEATSAAGSFGSVTVNAYLWLPVGLSGVALMIGAAFGVFLIARSGGPRDRWSVAINAALVGVCSALVYLIIAALLPSSIGTASGLASGTQVTLGGLTVRTVAMAFLLAGSGALGGYALAASTPDADNLFSAAWRWAHRARGAVRTVVESVVIYTAVFTVVGLLLLIAGAIKGQEMTGLLLFPLLFPALPILVFVAAALGSVSVITPGNAGSISLWSSSSSNPPAWLVIIVFVVLLLTSFYIALRVSARNTYDPSRAGWDKSWRSPLITAGIWLVLSFLVASFAAGIRLSGSLPSMLSMAGSGTMANVTLSPAPWFFILAALWAFLVEVVALTFGPAVVRSQPGLWRFLVGGTVPVQAPTGMQAPTVTTPEGSQTAVPQTSVLQNAGPQTAGPQADVPQSAGPQTAVQPPAMQGQTMPQPIQGAPAGQYPQTDQYPQSGQQPQPGQYPPPGAYPPGIAPAPMYTTAGAPAIGQTGTAPIPTGAPMGVPMAPPAAAVPAKPMSAQAKRMIIIAAIVVAVLAALGIAYPVLNATVFGARPVAERYLQSIESGQYERANGIADPQLEGGRDALLKDNAAKAGKRMSNVRISATRSNGNVETVSFTYTVAGRMQSDTISVSPSGSRYLFFKNWKVTTPLLKDLAIYTTDSMTALDINGITVTEKNASEASGSGSSAMTFKVYPGEYAVSAHKSKYVTSDTVTVVAASRYSATARAIRPKATRQLTTDIEAAIKQKLDVCARSTEMAPPGCPIRGYAFYGDDSYKDIKWSITSYPRVSSVSLTGGSFYTSRGSATLSYQQKSFFDDSWEPQSDRTSIYLSGSFTLNGDELKVDLDDSGY